MTKQITLITPNDPSRFHDPKNALSLLQEEGFDLKNLSRYLLHSREPCFQLGDYFSAVVDRNAVIGSHNNRNSKPESNLVGIAKLYARDFKPPYTAVVDRDSADVATRCLEEAGFSVEVLNASPKL